MSKSKMKSIELTKDVAIALLKGVKPNYNVMSRIPKDLGEYYGGFNDEWEWKSFDETTPYTTEELYEFYLLCKNSWN